MSDNTAALPAKEYAPIVHLVTALESAGCDLAASGGYLTTLWHANRLDDRLARYQIKDARKAAQKALEAIAAYEDASASTTEAA